MRQVRHDAHCPDWLELATCRFCELRITVLDEPLRVPGRNSAGGLPTPKVAYSRIGSRRRPLRRSVRVPPLVSTLTGARDFRYDGRADP